MSKKSEAKSTGQRNTRSLLFAFSTLIVLLAVVVALFSLSNMNDQAPGTAWSVDASDALSFSHRDLVSPRANLIEDTANYSLETISYSSYDTTVYGLLRIPKNVPNPPVVIVLPAATVTKEGDSAMAERPFLLGIRLAHAGRAGQRR